ncbi:MAG TPA: hypothetical protein VEX62_14065, partial [Candidatus Limnocylindrales bacterium]|nr:hypothetical protein [Candidatus Limnocylindrales bacterium]
AFPQDFAVPSGTTGMALLFAGAPQTIVLLDTDCQQIDELEWTDTSMAIRIDGAGALTAIEPPKAADPEGLLEYPDCMSGFGAAPAAGERVIGASGTIVFGGNEGGAWQVDAATAEVQNMVESSGPTFDSEHAVSPDGATIAFTRFSGPSATADLFVADAGGGNERMLVEGASEPTWSPDGTRIACLRIDPFAGGPVLSVIDVEGGESTEVAEDASTPRWSPDGSQIAFMAVDFARLNQPVLPPPAELQVVDADGSSLATIAEASPFAGPPAWSPDGTKLAFSGGSETTSTIDVVDAGGGEVSTVAEVEDAMLNEPAWDTDGGRIAFVISSATLFSATGAIGMVSSDGGEVTRLAEMDNAYFASPIWSPDGEWLAAARSSGLTLSADLVVIEVASGEETVLATGAMRALSWRE